MISFPNAKINIGLNILRRREDGYHDIESFFYPVHWQDALEVIPSKELVFNTSGRSIPPDPKGNLCLQAYALLKKDFDLPPVSIHLHKNIPIGAGLGGGSADGSFMITLLDKQFDLGLGISKMEGYARQMGSDCAFFIENKPKFCFGKGDEFADLDRSLEGMYIVLVYPNLGISTKEAYAKVSPKVPEVGIKEIVRQPIETWRDQLANDFEPSLFPKYPILEEVKDKLYQEGAVYASMTGSGSTLFGLFREEIHLLDRFPKDYSVWQGTLD